MVDPVSLLNEKKIQDIKTTYHFNSDIDTYYADDLFPARDGQINNVAPNADCQVANFEQDWWV